MDPGGLSKEGPSGHCVVQDGMLSLGGMMYKST